VAARQPQDGRRGFHQPSDIRIIGNAPISARALIAFAVLERIKGLRLPVRPVKPTCD
jgi:hypothetical protein